MHFIEEYKKRYGSVHPNFFTGTFEEAIAESCSKPPREVTEIKDIKNNDLLNNSLILKQCIFDLEKIISSIFTS